MTSNHDNNSKDGFVKMDQQGGIIVNHVIPINTKCNEYTFEFKPLFNITTFELAKCMNYLMLLNKMTVIPEYHINWDETDVLQHFNIQKV